MLLKLAVQRAEKARAQAQATVKVVTTRLITREEPGGRREKRQERGLRKRS